MTDTAGLLQGPEKATCGCGCEAYGRPKKAWRDGQRCVRGCHCKRCMGKQNRARGDAKARKVRQTLKLGGANSRHEEHWGGLVRVEVKSGAKAGPVFTAYDRERAQSDANKAVGDVRPFAACYALGSRQLAVLTVEDLAFILEGL